MSNRSIVELNHDYAIPHGDEAALLRFARGIMAYMRAADPAELPEGVSFRHYRHHTEPDPMADRMQSR